MCLRIWINLCSITIVPDLTKFMTRWCWNYLRKLHQSYIKDSSGFGKYEKLSSEVHFKDQWHCHTQMKDARRRISQWRHSDAEHCNDGDDTMMTPWRRWWYCCHNNKPTTVMKIDPHCSTLHQVCPHCAPIRAPSHYSSSSQWVWRWKKRWKVPSLAS